MRRRPGFTLVELLMAIMIIGILVAILLPAVNSVRRAACRSAVAAEIQSFNQGLAAFTLVRGSLPPSRFVCSETGDYSQAFFNAQWPNRADRDYVRTRAVATLRALFPRVATSMVQLATRPQCPATAADNPLNIPGITFYDFNGNGKLDVAPYELTGDECLVFFLGGIPKPFTGTDGMLRVGMIGFATDPRNPFQPDSYTDCTMGSTEVPQRVTSSVEFKSDRLFDQDGDGMPNYADNYSGSANPTPYAYFAAVGNGVYDPSDCDFASEPDGSPSPIGGFVVFGLGSTGTVASPAPNPYSVGPVLPVTGPYETGPLGSVPGFSVGWTNPNTYQIVSAGADRQFGPGGWWDNKSRDASLPFPATANQTVTGSTMVGDARSVERDNITNFSSGQLQ